MAIKPYKLNVGSTIGIVAPAGACYNPEAIEMAGKNIKSMGFNVILGRSVYERKGYLAGRDFVRANDINNFFKRKDIDCIMCLRGGYGSQRILDLIDYGAIVDNPKIFLGYSDITAIHCAVNKLCNVVTFHGPMALSDFSGAVDEYTKEMFLKAVTSTLPLGEFKNPIGYTDIQTLSIGEAEGEIIGGNLSLICSGLGTPYEIDTRGKILLIEEIGEEPYRIDRMLTQLILARKLQECCGIVLGQWTDCEPQNPEKSLSLVEVFEDRLLPLGIPILYNAAFGHDKTKATVPFGVVGRITRNGKFIIGEQALI